EQAQKYKAKDSKNKSSRPYETGTIKAKKNIKEEQQRIQEQQCEIEYQRN
ncbi:1833_t:CDS:1, partial [Diversispora eburnea]